MNSGVHELVHLVKCTESFGPSNTTSCFVFEELNRKVLNFIKGKNLIGEEFIKVFSVAQSLYSNLNIFDTSNKNIASFIDNNSQLKTSNRKNQIQLEKFILLRFFKRK